MRIFIALDIDSEIRECIREFVDKVRGTAPDVRWVSEESLHVTLKFIGEKAEAEVKRIEATLQSIHAKQFQLSFRGTGFFPTAKAARVFWLGIEAQDLAFRQQQAKGGGNVADLARNIEDVLSTIGIPKEARAFSPHLTLARSKGGSGAPEWRKGDERSPQFANLQAYLEKHPPPEFDTMTAREFFLYQSQLSSKGPRYTKIARFELLSPTV